MSCVILIIDSFFLIIVHRIVLKKNMEFLIKIKLFLFVFFLIKK